MNKKAEMYEKVRSIKLALLLHNSPTPQSKADWQSAILASLPSWMSKWRSATLPGYTWTLSTILIPWKLKAIAHPCWGAPLFLTQTPLTKC